jgi:hypothetical protein
MEADLMPFSDIISLGVIENMGQAFFEKSIYFGSPD